MYGMDNSFGGVAELSMYKDSMLTINGQPVYAPEFQAAAMAMGQTSVSSGLGDSVGYSTDVTQSMNKSYGVDSIKESVTYSSTERGGYVSQPTMSKSYGADSIKESVTYSATERGGYVPQPTMSKSYGADTVSKSFAIGVGENSGYTSQPMSKNFAVDTGSKSVTQDTTDHSLYTTQSMSKNFAADMANKSYTHGSSEYSSYTAQSKSCSSVVTPSYGATQANITTTANVIDNVNSNMRANLAHIRDYVNMIPGVIEMLPAACSCDATGAAVDSMTNFYNKVLNHV